MISQTARQKILTTELIDTLWNVNDKLIAENTAQSAELIDTLWNVNL